MAEREGVRLTETQRSLIEASRAAWEEGEREEALERLRQQEEDAETLRAIADLLRNADFAQTAVLTFVQMERFLALVRALAPNPNLDRRLLQSSSEGQAIPPLDSLNADLRDLLYGKAPMATRLNDFMRRRHAGGQTALQLLCAVYPAQVPLLAPKALRLLDFTEAQRAAAQTRARSEFALEEENIPPTHPVMRLLSELPLYAALREATDAPHYVALHRLLTQGLLGKTRTKRRAVFYAPTPAESPSAVREPTTPYAVESAPERTPSLSDLRPTPPDLSGFSESEVLAALEREVAAQGFTYPPFALRSYYLSLQTRPFLLLGGLPGTGKSRLTALVAAALTGEAETQYRLLPARPDWTTSAPLWSARSPFLAFLTRASRPENAYRAFFLCLDEVNIARIEHYGAELLSAMESPDRTLTLPDGQTLRLPDNLFLVGTLNRDETAHPLTRKTLDRANLLVFPDVRLQETEAESPPPSPALEVALRQAVFLQTRLRTTKEAKERLRRIDASFPAEIVRVLSEVNAALEPAGLPISYRGRDEIARWCAQSFDRTGQGLLVSDDARGNLALALDLQLQQRVLPRLFGRQEQIEAPMQDLLRYAERNQFAQTARRLGRLLYRLQKNGVVYYDDV